MFAAADKEVNGMAYPMEFRVLVADAYDECGSSTEVALTFKCSASWVRRLIQRRALTDSLEPLPARRPDTRKLREAELEQLRTLVAGKPDMTLAELTAALDCGASVPTVWRTTRKLGLTLKKSPRTPPNRTGPTSRNNATAGSRASTG
jgi:transposase